MKKIILSAVAVLLISPARAQQIEAEAALLPLLGTAKADYERARPGAPLEAIATSTSASAFARLCRGEAAAGGTTRAIAQAERQQCAQNGVNLVELPLAASTISVIVNPLNSWASQIGAGELQRAWSNAEDRPRTWRDLNSAWPAAPLKLYGPAPRLGLHQQFRSEIANAARNPGSSAVPRGDMTFTEELEGVAEVVARDVHALGVLDSATYADHSRRVRRIAVSTESGAVALSYSLFLYVSAGALAHERFRGLLEYLLLNGTHFAAQANLSALPAAAYDDARQRLTATR